MNQNNIISQCPWSTHMTDVITKIRVFEINNTSRKWCQHLVTYPEAYRKLCFPLIISTQTIFFLTICNHNKFINSDNSWRSNKCLWSHLSLSKLHRCNQEGILQYARLKILPVLARKKNVFCVSSSQRLYLSNSSTFRGKPLYIYGRVW